MIDMGMIVIYWLIAAGVFLVFEIVTMGLTTVWFAGGALMGALLAKLGLSLGIQIAAFVAVSAVLLFFTRPLARKYLNSKTVATNADSLIGCTGIVIQTIDNLQAQGQVKVSGQVWSARTEGESGVLEEGTRVRILSISGVKLLVEPIEE